MAARRPSDQVGSPWKGTMLLWCQLVCWRGIESKNVTGQWMPGNASSLDCYLREAPDRTTIRLRVVEASAKAKEFAMSRAAPITLLVRRLARLSHPDLVPGLHEYERPRSAGNHSGDTT
jgi:hypothetical protein